MTMIKMLQDAAQEGDLDKVIYLTTSPELENKVDPSCNFNYPLKIACMEGHLEIVKFLITFPDKALREKVTTSKRIQEVISSSLINGNKEIYFLLKEKFPDYNNAFFKDSYDVTSALIKVITHGKLEPLKLILDEAKPKRKVEAQELLEICIQNDKIEMFEFLISSVEQKKLKKNNLEGDLMTSILAFNRLDFLRPLIEHAGLNINEKLTGERIKALLILDKADSLQHILVEYDYQPTKETVSELNAYLEEQAKTLGFAEKVKQFLTLIEKISLKRELESQLSSLTEELTHRRHKL